MRENGWKNGHIISVPFIEYYIYYRLFEPPDKPQELTFSDDLNAPQKLPSRNLCSFDSLNGYLLSGRQMKLKIWINSEAVAVVQKLIRNYNSKSGIKLGVTFKLSLWEPFYLWKASISNLHSTRKQE